MKILALDLATWLGFAHGRPGDQPKWGTVRLPSTGEDVGRFLVAYEDWLIQFVTLESIEWIVFEAPILTAGKTNITTARKLMCLAGVTEMIATRLGLRCSEGHLQAVKKFFTDNGRADKQLMVSTARDRYGWRAENDNEADALALWLYQINVRWPGKGQQYLLQGMGAAS